MENEAKEEVLVSIIVPVYNAQKYLEYCIRSILNQSAAGLEIIFVDDGSKDQSLEICRKYEGIDTRIHVIHQENAGANGARKAGLKQAKGTYVGFIDSDDWIAPDMFMRLLEYSQGCQADMISSGLIMHWPKADQISCDTIAPGCYTGKKLEELYASMLCNCQYYEFGILPNLCGKLIRRKILCEVFESIDEKITYGEDAAIVYPACLKSKMVVSVRKAYYHYNIHNESATFRTDVSQFDSLYRLYRYLKGFFEQESMKGILEKQLKYYVTLLGFRAFKEVYDIDFSPLAQYWMPDYFLQAELLYKKQVVLYGAGKVGKAYYRQLKEKGISVAAWLDSNWTKCANTDMDMEIHAPEKIRTVTYDIVLIAVMSKEAAGEIKHRLMKIGVREEKIMWYKPRGISMVEQLIGW